MKKLILVTITLISILFITLIMLVNYSKNSSKNNLNESDLTSLGSFKVNLNNKNIETISHITVAICNKTNFCQDYEILCEEGKVIDTIPIPNATIQNSKNWIDPRPIEEIINPCLN